MRVRIGTFQRGWAVTLILDYHAGEPAYRYSRVETLWNATYPFGNPANLQPTERRVIELASPVESATLRLVTTGHGWGQNNSQNAAEFYETTHHILVDDQITFEHTPWTTCSPNPDGCQPQFGTWEFARAGWCPGAISPGDTYSLDDYLNTGEIELFYRFDPEYQDYCHPNQPSCVSGLTCPNCDDGFNPILAVSGNLITYGNEPLTASIVTDTNTPSLPASPVVKIQAFPNPTSGATTIQGLDWVDQLSLYCFDSQGRLRWQHQQAGGVPGELWVIPSQDWPAGVYHVRLTSAQGSTSLKILKQ
jgi:hypothetical protein